MVRRRVGASRGFSGGPNASEMSLKIRNTRLIIENDGFFHRDFSNGEIVFLFG